MQLEAALKFAAKTVKARGHVWSEADVEQGSVPFEQDFCLGFAVLTAVTTKNAVFWDVTPCGFL
jgi:hypothetical protein